MAASGDPGDVEASGNTSVELGGGYVVAVVLLAGSGDEGLEKSSEKSHPQFKKTTKKIQIFSCAECVSDQFPLSDSHASIRFAQPSLVM